MTSIQGKVNYTVSMQQQYRSKLIKLCEGSQSQTIPKDLLKQNRIIIRCIFVTALCWQT